MCGGVGGAGKPGTSQTKCRKIAPLQSRSASSVCKEWVWLVSALAARWNQSTCQLQNVTTGELSFFFQVLFIPGPQRLCFLRHGAESGPFPTEFICSGVRNFYRGSLVVLGYHSLRKPKLYRKEWANRRLSEVQLSRDLTSAQSNY